MVRYPAIEVSLRTPNPMLLVARVRDQMRRRGVSPSEIASFSTQALTGDPKQIRRVCSEWVETYGRSGDSEADA